MGGWLIMWSIFLAVAALAFLWFFLSLFGAAFTTGGGDRPSYSPLVIGVVCLIVALVAWMGV